MKKSLLLAMFLAALCFIHADITDHYAFTAGSQTYVAVTGTQIASIQGDDLLSDPINIGFTFPYGDDNFTQVVVSSNGWVGLGTELDHSNLGNELSSTSWRPVLAPLWDDLSMGSGNVQYLLSGGAPNRIFTIQYTNAKWTYSGTNQFSFQVRLYESGTVEMKYGPRNGAPSYPSASIGINMAPGGSGWFYSVTPGSPATASTTVENNQIDAFPALNTMYVFTPIDQINNDLAATSVTGDASPLAGSSYTYAVTVENPGVYSQAIYQVKLVTAANVELASVVGTPIPPGQTIIYDLAWTPSATGPLTIHGKVVLPGDEVPSNDLTPALNLIVFPAGTGNVTIGAGDVTARVPVDMYWKNSLWEGIYYPSEFGFGATNVLGLGLYNNFTQDLLGMPTKIWLGATNAANLSAGWIPSTQLSLVFDGEVDYPIGENTVNILFDTPFPYFGGNLVMMVNRPMDTQYYSSSDNFYCQTEGGNRALIVYSDYVNFDPADPPSDPYIIGLFPKTTFFYGSGTPADDPQAPALATRLLGCHPNPFNPETAIAFRLKESSRVRIAVYNLKGQLVATLLDDELSAGLHSVAWDGRDDSGRPASSGMYLLRMSAGNYAGSLKMILLK